MSSRSAISECARLSSKCDGIRRSFLPLDFGAPRLSVRLRKEGFMPARRLKEYLDREGVRYTSESHPTAYTAQEVAAAAHIPGKQFAKTVMVKLDCKLAMVVLPAHRKVILQDL